MGTTRDGVDAVLDYYEARCARSSGHLSESLRTLDHADFNQRWTPGSRRAASVETVRFGDADGGYVACLDVGETRLDPQEILRRAEAVIATCRGVSVGVARTSITTGALPSTICTGAVRTMSARVAPGAWALISTT